MKKLSVAAIGLVGDLLVGFLTPGLAVTGIVVALAVDGRRQPR